MANFLMPKLGHLMEEGMVATWLKREGDTVSKGEVILQVETDKAVLDVECEFSGLLSKVAVQEGDTVPVGELLAVIE
jgi:pyruvate dehydrogenase E2 component (dihydrolipoamide acetyltransferase)